MAFLSRSVGHEGGLSYVEDRLNRGDGMVWSTNGMAPAHNMPPPGYGAMAMGLLPPGFMRPDQVRSRFQGHFQVLLFGEVYVGSQAWLNRLVTDDDTTEGPAELCCTSLQMAEP